MPLPSVLINRGVEYASIARGLLAEKQGQYKILPSPIIFKAYNKPRLLTEILMRPTTAGL